MHTYYALRVFISYGVSGLGLGHDTHLETHFCQFSVSASKVSGLVSVGLEGYENFMGRLMTFFTVQWDDFNEQVPQAVA